MGLKIAILGAGNIGGALLGGILKSGIAEPKDVVVTDARPERRKELEAQWKVRALPEDNRAAAQGRDIVILAVKPFTLPKVLDEISGVLKASQVVISVAAAVPISFIESVIGRRIPVFRAMPNIPVLVEEGAVGFAGNSATTPEQRTVVEKIFGALGAAVYVEESQLDAVTGLSGSGPAYVYTIIEALVDGGKKMGLTHDVATRLAVQTVLGAAKMVRETKRHPAVLRDEVVTPGGTTIAGLHEMEKHALRSTLISTVEAATLRSREIREQLVANLSMQTGNKQVGKSKARIAKTTATSKPKR